MIFWGDTLGIGSFSSNFRTDQERLERIKILFQFILMLVCSVIIGWLVVNSLTETFYQNSVLGVSTHFETVFINCKTFYDYIKEILLYALSDILSVFVIFVVSFSAFNYLVCDLLLVYNGLRIGTSVSFLSAFISNSIFAYNIGLLRFVVFVFFKAVVLMLMLDYAYRAALYSQKLKLTAPNGRPNVKVKVLLPFIVYTLTYIGSVIIINGVYCWLIYLLK